MSQVINNFLLSFSIKHLSCSDNQAALCSVRVWQVCLKLEKEIPPPSQSCCFLSIEQEEGLRWNQFALPGRGFPEILPCDEVFTNMPIYGHVRAYTGKAYVLGLRCVRKNTETKVCLCKSFSLGLIITVIVTLWLETECSSSPPLFPHVYVLYMFSSLVSEVCTKTNKIPISLSF